MSKMLILKIVVLEVIMSKIFVKEIFLLRAIYIGNTCACNSVQNHIF